MSDLERLLSQIRHQADLALEALKDEREAGVRASVLLIGMDAESAAEIVTSW